MLAKSAVIHPAEEERILPESAGVALRRDRDRSRVSDAAPGCIHHWFEQQAAATPNSIAASCEDEDWTYRELNTRANTVATRLRRMGVRPDVPVGICVSRSLNMMAGLLGILKAGGAYVPLDPAYPQERLAFMLRDARIPFLLTERRLAPSLPAHSAATLCLDEMDFDSGCDNPAADVSPDHLAYVIYTSGSTGEPKGVMVCHRNVINFFDGMDAAIGREPGTWLAVTSISFDISVLELFWTLTRGFRVVLRREQRLAAHNRACSASTGSGTTVAEQILRHGVTHLQCTPSQAAMLLEDRESLPALRRLRKLLLGGEPLPRDLADRLAGCGELFNMYGPTETTVWSTTYRLNGGTGPIPIGRPILNTQIHILDGDLRPVPPGEPGELYIGGEGVVRGYLNRPELTAERFLSDPFNSRPGARLYRTGDLARWLPDGNVEFLGRADQQIKLRGFRIELGEIESALRQCPEVQDAVATVWEASPGDQRLVAFVVPRGGNPVDAASLRSFLQHKLPEYMLPSHFEAIGAVPLTPNGKVDRKALPKPKPSVSPARPGACSETHLEKTISGIWRDLLQLPDVGLDDNFFDLGGHSVLLAHLHGRLREALGVEVPLLQLFQFSTVRSLAAHLSGGTAEPRSLSRIRERARRQSALFGITQSQPTSLPVHSANNAYGSEHAA